MSPLQEPHKTSPAAPALVFAGALIAVFAWLLPVSLKSVSKGLLRSAGAGTPSVAAFGRDLVDSEKIGPALFLLDVSKAVGRSAGARPRAGACRSLGPPALARRVGRVGPVARPALQPAPADGPHSEHAGDDLPHPGEGARRRPRLPLQLRLARGPGRPEDPRRRLDRALRARQPRGRPAARRAHPPDRPPLPGRAPLADAAARGARARRDGGPAQRARRPRGLLPGPPLARPPPRLDAAVRAPAQHRERPDGRRIRAPQPGGARPASLHLLGRDALGLGGPRRVLPDPLRQGRAPRTFASPSPTGRAP